MITIAINVPTIGIKIMQQIVNTLCVFNKNFFIFGKFKFNFIITYI